MTDTTRVNIEYLTWWAEPYPAPANRVVAQLQHNPASREKLACARQSNTRAGRPS